MTPTRVRSMYAKTRGADGLICGHVHAAAMREVQGVRYLTCGDWAESCTAIVEHERGCLKLVAWDVGPRPAAEHGAPDTP